MNEAKRQVVTLDLSSASSALLAQKALQLLAEDSRSLAQAGLAQEQMYRWTGSHSAAKKAEA